MKKINISKNFLKKQYINNKKSIRTIAKEFKCGRETIRRNFKKFHIKCRTKVEGNRLINRKGKNHPNYGKKFPKNSRRMKGKNNPMYGKSYWFGKKRPKIAKLNKAKMLKLWKNPKYREKQLSAIINGLKLKPNKPEKLLNTLLNKLYSKEYKYVGDGEIFIAGFVPDFINCNGQKKIIELYGDYWHNLRKVKKRDEQRLKIYAKYGYKTLIIWEHELKDLTKLKNKILKFNKEGIKCVY